jgi:hypothetical protein
MDVRKRVSDNTTTERQKSNKPKLKAIPVLYTNYKIWGMMFLVEGLE